MLEKQQAEFQKRMIGFKQEIFLMSPYHVIAALGMTKVLENEKKTIRHRPIYVPCTCPIQLKPTNVSPAHPLHYLHALTQRWDTSCATHGHVQGHGLGHN